jgi:hypothetical protein
MQLFLFQFPSHQSSIFLVGLGRLSLRRTELPQAFPGNGTLGSENRTTEKIMNIGTT